MVVSFDECAFLEIIDFSEKLQKDFYLLARQMVGASAGKRLELANAMYSLVLANLPQINQTELRYFVDVVCGTIAYQARLRTETLTKFLGRNNWYTPPRNLQRELMLDMAYERESQIQQTNQELYDAWRAKDCAEDRQIETKLSYNQAFANAFGSRQIVHKDLEHALIKQAKLLEKEEKEDYNDVLLNLGKMAENG